MPKINIRQKISQWLQSREEKLYWFSWDKVPIYKNFTKWLQSREKNFTEWLLDMGIRRRFMLIFSLTLIFGLIYGLTAYFTDDYCQNIHFYMSADFAGRLLTELMGYAVLIYGFFAAFLIYTISEIPKVSNEEYSGYEKVISKVMNIFAMITAFVVDFIFFSAVSMYELENIKLKVGVGSPVVDYPFSIGAYVFFFMILIILLGYLVFSLVMGLLNIRGEQA